VRLRGSPRVALCFGTYPPERNGGADFLACFSRSLVEAGGAGVVVLTSEADAPADEERDGVLVRRVVSEWSLLGGRRSLRRANDALAAAGADVVHVFFPDSVWRQRYQLPVRLGPGLPLVTTFWSLGLGRRSPVATRLTSLGLLARSSALTSHDPVYLAALRPFARGARPVAWLPVGNNLHLEGASGRPQTLLGGVDVPRPYLVYFGQLDPTRGVEDLFAALVEVRRERDVRLVMVGSAGREHRYAADTDAHAYFRRIRGLPQNLGIADAVVWTPYLPDADVARLLQASELCVLPYRRTSVGRSALAAALDLGVPTVLAGTPTTVAPLVPGRHVALVPPGQPATLAAELARLLADAGERARLARGARAAAAFFVWPRSAAAALGVYRQVLR
jgi:glycosyltransferase involved in cell wall biosynthesis